MQSKSSTQLLSLRWITQLELGKGIRSDTEEASKARELLGLFYEKFRSQGEVSACIYSRFDLTTNLYTVFVPLQRAYYNY